MPAAESSSLLTDEVKQWVGTEHRFGPEPIIERDVLRYLVGTQARLPAPGERVRVPAMFYRSIGRPIAEVARVGDDGLWPGLRPAVGTGQTLAGGIDVEFSRELVVGDVITGTRRLISLDEKVGRRKRFVLAVWRSSLLDEDSVEVVRETVSEIMY